MHKKNYSTIKTSINLMNQSQKLTSTTTTKIPEGSVAEELRKGEVMPKLIVTPE